MLPPGHIAAGYLTTKLILDIGKPAFNSSQTNQLLLWGAFFGFAPDLDMFYAFWKEKGFKHTGKNFDHRQFITHIPLLWLIAGLIIIFLARDPFTRYLGLIVWLCPWSHFILDSESLGIRWLYPFSKKFYALRNPGIAGINDAQGFFKHWFNLLKQYYKQEKLTFYVEIGLIILALVVLIAGV